MQQTGARFALTGIAQGDLEGVSTFLKTEGVFFQDESDLVDAGRRDAGHRLQDTNPP